MFNKIFKNEKKLSKEEKIELAKINLNRQIIKDLIQKWFKEILKTELEVQFVNEIPNIFRTYIQMILPRSKEYEDFLNAKRAYEETLINKLTLYEKEVDLVKDVDCTEDF